jgi:hypothetical protein
MPSSERPALTGLGPAIVRPRMLLGVLLSALLLSPFAFRVFLIHKYPGVYSWDALSRLWGAKNLVVRHWLPLPQLPVFFTEAYDWEIATMRMVYAAIGVAGSAVLGWFVSAPPTRPSLVCREGGLWQGERVGLAPDS